MGDVTKRGMLRLALAGLALAASLRPVEAGPCAACGASAGVVGWWDDRPLDVGARDDHAPRIDVDGDGVTSRIAIAFERRVAGMGAAWLATSDDGGCSFDTRAVAPAAGSDDHAPDVAVSLSQDAVALAFVRDGAIVATVSLDGGRTFPPPVVVDVGAPLDAAARPRLAMIVINGTPHVHVAWCEGGRLRLATSRASGAPGTWTASAAALSSRFVGYSSWTSAEVAADTRSRDPSTESAVTIVASGLAPSSTTPEVFAVRSNDSGATFLGDPQDVTTLDVPARVSETRPLDRPLEGATSPALDVSDDGTGEFYTWEVATYADERPGVRSCRADARAEEGAAPSTIAPWNDVDGVAGGLPRGSAVAIIPNPLQRPPAPETHLFVEDATGFGTLELTAWRGALDVNEPGWFVETCPGYVLTGLAPWPSAGGVVSGTVSADEDLSHVFVTWEDTRDGGGAIWWKRTDTVAVPVTNVVVAAGDCASGGGIAVTWQPPPSPPSCDVDHVRVDYGRAAGVYDAGVDVRGTTSAQVTGLVSGVTYFVRVTLVDEACNTAPAPETSGTSAVCAPVQCPLPVGGTLRAAKRPTEDDVELWWDPPPTDATHDAATSYDVYRSIDVARDGFALLANAPSPDVRDLGACLPTAARRHFYLVVARNACGTSGDEPLP